MLCFLEGAKINIQFPLPSLGCCGCLHSVLLWLCHRKQRLAAAIEQLALAPRSSSGVRGLRVIHAGIAVQPVLQLPRAEEIAAWRRGGFLGSTASVGAEAPVPSWAGGPALPRELALCSGTRPCSATLGSAARLGEQTTGLIWAGSTWGWGLVAKMSCF